MKKILVIEDDRSIRESIVELLEMEGFCAIGAENGKIGIQIAQKSSPDLILCDVMMPEVDGFTVLSKLRQDSTTATVPFIFLTARANKEDIRQGMELGADDFLAKPCTSAELLAAVASRFQKQSALEQRSQAQLANLRNSIALALPHELRTPLNGILGLAEVLVEDYKHISPTEVLEIAQGIQTSAERLHRLIQNFLLYAELEVALHDPTRIQTMRQEETHYAESVISNTATEVAQTQGRIDDLHLNLKNAVLKISELRLKKIVQELTENAFKFSKFGTPVTLTIALHEHDMTLYITDRGRGMTLEQLGELGAYMQFDRRFYEQQGSGLGLAISKRLVEIHGGRFMIDSVPEQQTVVQVVLPRGQASEFLEDFR